MKEQLLEKTNALNSFLQNVLAITRHPYSTGVQVEKLIVDLIDYNKEMNDLINQLPDPEEAEKQNTEA